MAAFTSPKTVASRRWRGRTFVGGGLSLRQTDPTHLRSIGQRLERLGRFVVRQTGKIRVRRMRRRSASRKKQAPPEEYRRAGSIPRRCSCFIWHRRDTGVARCAPRRFSRDAWPRQKLSSRFDRPRRSRDSREPFFYLSCSVACRTPYLQCCSESTQVAGCLFSCSRAPALKLFEADLRDRSSAAALS